MNIYLGENADVSYMDKLLLDPNGLLQVVDANVLSDLPATHLMLWGNKNGVYTFPTTELITWMKDKIAGRTAIEICSGSGVVGRALGITMTDSYIQTTPEMVAYYTALGQIPIFPAPDVKKLEANEAVDYYKPEVVVGCYVTQKYVDGDEKIPIGSSLYGIDELAMLPKIKTYINVGNFVTHKDKRIRSLPHKTYQFPWLFTRSGKPEYNEIVVWGED